MLDEHLEQQFAFDYMHRNKKAVEYGVLFTGIIFVAMGWMQFTTFGYVNIPLVTLGPWFLFQYAFFILKREWFWTHF